MKLDYEKLLFDMWMENPDKRAYEFLEYFKSMGVAEKQFYYTINKWNIEGVLNYGVSLRTSWLEIPIKKPKRLSVW